MNFNLKDKKIIAGVAIIVVIAAAAVYFLGLL